MNEVIIVAIAALNLVVMLNSEATTYAYSFFTHACLFLSMPIGLLSIVAIAMLGGAVPIMVLGILAAAFTVLHAIVVLGDGPGGG